MFQETSVFRFVLHQRNIGPFVQVFVAGHLLDHCGKSTGRSSNQRCTDHDPVLGILLELLPHVVASHVLENVSGNKNMVRHLDRLKLDG